MKVLYAGNFHDEWASEHYAARAFERLGHEVTRLGVNDVDQAAIVGEARKAKPDLLLFAKAGFNGADGPWPGAADAVVKMIQACRPHVGQVCCWLWDLMCPEFKPARWQWSEKIAAAVDLYAMSDGCTAPKLPNTAVVRQGAHDDVDESVGWPAEFAGDVLFLGDAYGDRPKLISALRSRFGARFEHVPHGVQGPALTRLVRSYRIVVGPHFPRFANYWSNRIYVVAGYGGLFAAPLVNGMGDEGWRPSQNFLSLPTEPTAMAAKVAEYLRCDEVQLRNIRKTGFEHARKLSYDTRVAELLEHLGTARVAKASKQAAEAGTFGGGTEFHLEESDEGKLAQRLADSGTFRGDPELPPHALPPPADVETVDEPTELEGAEGSGTT